MNQDRDRLEMIMEMFHQFGETMISADSLLEAIECGVLEDNGFARNREEAQELGQAMVERGFVFDLNRTDSLSRTARHDELDNAVLNIVTATPGLNTTEIAEKVRDVGVGFQPGDIGHAAERLIDQGHLRMEYGTRRAKKYYPTDNLFDGQR
jgi:hypothetical protein